MQDLKEKMEEILAEMKTIKTIKKELNAYSKTKSYNTWMKFNYMGLLGGFN